MQEFIAALVSFFLIQPLQAELKDRFGNVSQQTAAAMTACARDATPVLVQQATSDPWKTATQVFVVWTGMTPAVDVLAGTTPTCAAAVRSLKGEQAARSS
jgi:hypothetical protein